MMRFIFFILLAIGLSSCATLLNSDYSLVHLDSNEEHAQVQVLPDTATYSLPVDIMIRRQKQPLGLHLKTPTRDTIVIVKRRLDPMVAANLLVYGFGIIPDLLNPRGYRYPRFIHLDTPATKFNAPRVKAPNNFALNKKGQIDLSIGFSGMSHTTFNIGEDPYTTIMPLFTPELSIDYYYKEGKAIALRGVYTPAFSLGYDREFSRLYKSSQAGNVSLLWIRSLRRFHFNLGTSVLIQSIDVPGRSTDIQPAGSTLQYMQYDRSVSIGPALGIDWQISRYLTFGMHYLTGIYTINQTSFGYRDTGLWFNFKLRIPIRAQYSNITLPMAYPVINTLSFKK